MVAHTFTFGSALEVYASGHPDTFWKSGAAQTDTAYNINSDHNFCMATDVEFYCKHPSDTHLLPIQTSCHDKYSKKEIFWIFIEVNTSGISSALMAGVHISDASSTTFSESVY